MSGHVILYQNEIPVAPLGAVNVCATELSPFVAAVLPALAHSVPPWQPLVTRLLAAPDCVHPVNPLSNPPLVMPLPPPPLVVTVSETFVECVAVPSVPVSVSV